MRKGRALRKFSEHIRQCYRHAEECVCMARQQRDSACRQEFLDCQRRWPVLARAYELAECVEAFSQDQRKVAAKNRGGRVYFANFAAMALGTAFMLGGTIVDASVASGFRLTCNGSLTNTQADGDTLGQCDLNFISVKEMSEIENACGIPGTVDTPAENKCRIRAIVSPEASPAASGKLYRVLDVLTVDKW